MSRHRLVDVTRLGLLMTWTRSAVWTMHPHLPRSKTMTIPLRHSRATEEFEAFLRDAQVRMDSVTRNQTYQGVYGTLIVFRRRLTVQQVIEFAAVLPTVLSAILISDWDVDARPVPFDTRASMTAEVQSVRRNHNLSPNSVIADVAAAAWKHVDPIAFERCLERIGPDAVAFWSSSP